MGLFNLFSKKAAKPYKNDGINKIYDLLFCDNLDLYKSETKADGYPWDVLFAKNLELDKLKEVASNKVLESRQRILAYNLLSSNNSSSDNKELLGVIVEVALPHGLDVLAAFSDGTARYLNHSEKVLIWETQTAQSTTLIEELLSYSMNVVNQIGPWDKERKPFPSNGMIRITFLVSDGLYFGEGSFKVLQNDPLAGPVINSAALLMAYLTQHVVNK